MKKYVKARSPDECRAYAAAGALYWRGQSDDDEWILYEEDGYNFGKYALWFDDLCNPAVDVGDAAWQEQMEMYNASILVDDDEDG